MIVLRELAMNTNVNLLAPIGVLAALVLIHSLLVHRKGRAKFVTLAMLVVAVNRSYSS